MLKLIDSVRHKKNNARTWMMPQCRFAIRRFDFIGCSALLDTKNSVGLNLGRLIIEIFEINVFLGFAWHIDCVVGGVKGLCCVGC